MLIDGDGQQHFDPFASINTVISGREVTVEFTAHAKRRMEQRGITADEVLRCLRRPDVRGLEADAGKLRVRRHLESNRSLDVIYCTPSDDRIIVVSTFVITGAVR